MTQTAFVKKIQMCLVMYLPALQGMLNQWQNQINVSAAQKNMGGGGGGGVNDLLIRVLKRILLKH